MDVFDIQDARLLAEVRTKKWLEEFEADFHKPEIEMNKALFWQGFVPESVKGELRKKIPDVVNRFDKRYGGGKNA